MKKWKKRYIVITAIIFVVTCVVAVLLEYNDKRFSLEMV